jgi:hypothetical protein
MQNPVTGKERRSTAVNHIFTLRKLDEETTYTVNSAGKKHCGKGKQHF